MRSALYALLVAASVVGPVSTSQSDADGDGVGNTEDRCPTTPPGGAVGLDGCTDAERRTLPPGTIVVVDNSAGTFGKLFRVDPATGTQVTISMDQLFHALGDVAIDWQGNLFVTSNFPPSLLRVDPRTGVQTTVSVDTYFSLPNGIAVDRAGQILVADQGINIPGSVLRIDPSTGNQTLLAGGVPFGDPVKVLVDLDGSLLVSDPRAGGPFGPGVIWRLDPVSWAPSVAYSGGSLWFPVGIALDAHGDILVADPISFLGTGRIIRIARATGAQTVVSEGGFLVDPQKLAVDFNGDILVADGNALAGPAVIRIDPSTGIQTVVSSGGDFDNPLGLVVVRPALFGLDADDDGVMDSSDSCPDTPPGTPVSLVGCPITYNICPMFDQTKAVRSGSTIPIKLQLCDAAGGNVSAAQIVVAATGIARLSDGAAGEVIDAGNANPDDNFRYDSALSGYIFNLKTTGLVGGTYGLSFVAGGDPTVHVVQFQVR